MGHRLQNKLVAVVSDFCWLVKKLELSTANLPVYRLEAARFSRKTVTVVRNLKRALFLSSEWVLVTPCRYDFRWTVAC